MSETFDRFKKQAEGALRKFWQRASKYRIQQADQVEAIIIASTCGFIQYASSYGSYLEALNKAKIDLERTELRENLGSDLPQLQSKIQAAIAEMEIRKKSFFYRPWIYLEKIKYFAMGNSTTPDSYPSLYPSPAHPVSDPLDDDTLKVAKGVNYVKGLFFRNVVSFAVFAAKAVLFCSVVFNPYVGDLLPKKFLQGLNYVTNLIVDPIAWVIDKAVKAVSLFVFPVLSIFTAVNTKGYQNYANAVKNGLGYITEIPNRVKNYIIETPTRIKNWFNDFSNLFAKAHEPIKLKSLRKDDSEADPLLGAKDNAQNKHVDPPQPPVGAASKANVADAKHPEEKQPLLPKSAVTTNGKIHAAILSSQSPAIAQKQELGMELPQLVGQESKRAPKSDVGAEVKAEVKAAAAVVKQPEPPKSAPKPAPGKVKAAVDKWAELMKDCYVAREKSLSIKDLRTVSENLARWKNGIFSPCNQRGKAIAEEKGSNRLRVR